MELDEMYGGFLISNNVLSSNVKITKVLKERIDMEFFNGWCVYGEGDVGNCLTSPSDFTVIGATKMGKILPALLENFEEPYGTTYIAKYQDNEKVELIINKE